MKMGLLYSLVFVFLLAFNAEASRWERIDLEPDKDSEDKTFIDLESFHINDKELTYWEKNLKPDNSYKLSRIALDCEKKEEKLLDILIYNEMGKVTENHSYKRDWVAVSSDSNTERMHYSLCKDGVPRPAHEREFYIKNYRKTYFSVSPQDVKRKQ